MEQIKISPAYRVLVDLRVISVFYSLLIAYGLMHAEFTPVWSLALWLVAGFVTVNFWEYVIHRWLFHPTRWGNQFKLWILKIHARHHVHTENHLYSVAPISTSLGVILASLGFQTIFNPSSNARWCYFVALCLSYLYHEFVHHWVHHIQSGHWLHKAYVRFHDGHHGESMRHNFGFISPLWDVVFGTYK